VPAPRQLLYIEDNAANLALVQKVLQHGGAYQVTGAASGEEGLDLVRAQAPDLVLVDLDLPQMTGFDVVRELKADPRLARIPIVAISASVMKQERQQALDVGCVYFLEKPFDLDELRMVVSEAIAGRLVGRPS
jgi:CheY-like chemotaxis protein